MGLSVVSVTQWKNTMLALILFAFIAFAGDPISGDIAVARLG